MKHRSSSAVGACFFAALLLLFPSLHHHIPERIIFWCDSIKRINTCTHKSSQSVQTISSVEPTKTQMDPHPGSGAAQSIENITRAASELLNSGAAGADAAAIAAGDDELVKRVRDYRTCIAALESELRTLGDHAGTYAAVDAAETAGGTSITAGAAAVAAVAAIAPQPCAEVQRESSGTQATQADTSCALVAGQGVVNHHHQQQQQQQQQQHEAVAAAAPMRRDLPCAQAAAAATDPEASAAPAPEQEHAAATLLQPATTAADAVTADADHPATAAAAATALEPSDWQVPPHCIPIHANVTTFDWSTLAAATQFDVVMMDPPWQLATANPTRGVALGYSQLSDESVTALPVPALQRAGGLLFVWVINAKYKFTLDLFDKWGYEWVPRMLGRGGRMGWLWCWLTVEGPKVWRWLCSRARLLSSASSLIPNRAAPTRRRLVDEIVWVKMTVNRRLFKSHGYYLQHAKEVRGGWGGGGVGGSSWRGRLGGWRGVVSRGDGSWPTRSARCLCQHSETKTDGQPTDNDNRSALSVAAVRGPPQASCLAVGAAATAATSSWVRGGGRARSPRRFTIWSSAWCREVSLWKVVCGRALLFWRDHGSSAEGSEEWSFAASHPL